MPIRDEVYVSCVAHERLATSNALQRFDACDHLIDAKSHQVNKVFKFKLRAIIFLLHPQF